jgi:hypothetical protein
MIAAALAIALVVQDPTPLRAAPHDTAARQATLWQGEWLEVRGERLGYVQVYDHRRERPGYVREWQVRTFTLDAASAPRLRALVEFVKDTPGSEALGIGLWAALLKAAPPQEVGPELFDALGTMAERLARRATRGKPGDESLAAHLDVAASYGVKLNSFELEGRTRVCYEGDAFRRVLAMGGLPAQRARAAMALTEESCIDPTLGPVQRVALDEWRWQVLEQVDPSRLPPLLANRIHLRRAAVSAGLAYQLARRGDAARAERAAQEAVDSLARVDKLELADEDQTPYAEAAVRVSASRWAGEPLTPPAGAGLRLDAAPGAPGETCLKLVDPKVQGPLAERCTYGLPWIASVRRSPSGKALAVSVQLGGAWTELWVFHQEEGRWIVDPLTPATTDPDLGYVELAGWTPDGRRLLVAREAKAEGKLKRTFEVVRVDAMAVEASAARPELLGLFRRWQAADWKDRTLALR